MSPGAWLSDMCQERYEVREKKTTKKVIFSSFLPFLLLLLLFLLCLLRWFHQIFGLVGICVIFFGVWICVAETKRIEGHGKYGK